MSKQRSHAIPPTVTVLFPVDPDDLNGLVVGGEAEQVSMREDHGVGILMSVEGKLTWIDDFEYFVFQVLADGTRMAVRNVTAEDIKKFRVPIWIQDEEVPICCGREMVFVGQIDDNSLCMERPVAATLWWHDAASFYVFTCPQCLECEAVGQQF